MKDIFKAYLKISGIYAELFYLFKKSTNKDFMKTLFYGFNVNYFAYLYTYSKSSSIYLSEYV